MPHASHCCLKHGCKYNASDCPVVAGKVTALNECEDCEMNRELEETVKTAYAKYRDGDHLSDDEIEILLSQIEAATPILAAHPDFALFRRMLTQDSIQLDGYRRARKAR